MSRGLSRLGAVALGGDTVFLGDTASGWRISSAGCRLQGNKPADCELEN